MENHKAAKVVLRELDAGDEAFIMATWLNGNRYGNSYYGEIESNDYFNNYAEHIKKTISLHGTRIEVACIEETPHVIIGFIVYTGSAVHWIFVKSDYRNKGVARLLWQHKEFTTATNITKIGRALIKKFNLKFNPFIGETK